MKITILTPSYNRSDRLPDLFNSLCRQSNKNFEWLIVDDGSNDSTKSIVSDMNVTADFPIRYIWKENGGKHSAINKGVREISSELTFIVDSDDTLMDNAIDIILQYHKKYCSLDNICGYSFLRCFPDGKINGKLFYPDERVDSYINVRINEDDTFADKAEVFFTKCLLEYPFPEFPNEHFLGEDLIWIQMSRKYNMVHINKGIYVGNYMEDGLTKNRRKHNIASPKGCMNRAAEFMKPDIKFKYRIKGGLQYVIYGSIAGYKIIDLMQRTENKFIFIACALPGIFIRKIWKTQYK